MLGALDEADVRDRIEEAADVGEDAVLARVGPELAGDLELFVDVDRLGEFVQVDFQHRLGQHTHCAVHELIKPVGLIGNGLE